MQIVSTCELPLPAPAALTGRWGAPTLQSLAQLRQGTAPEAQALICLLSERIDAAVMDAMPRLAVIANYAVGTNNIDIDAASARGIVVCNTPDVLSVASAELTLALIFAAARHVVASDALVRSGTWQGWAPNLLCGTQLRGRWLGIVGLGRIGNAVAEAALGLGMHVGYHRGQPTAACAGFGGSRLRAFVHLDDLVAASDIVSLHCPLNAATAQLFDQRRIGLLRPHAILINTARGECVDEDAVCDALVAGRLAAAAFDVFVGEPKINPRLRETPGVTLSAHTGSATVTARQAMAALCYDAVAAVLDGTLPTHAVNSNKLNQVAVAARAALMRKS